MDITISNISIHSNDSYKAEEWKAEIRVNNGQPPLMITLLQARRIHAALGFILEGKNSGV